MRILVYGAGVQGCELAHRLLQNKKNVVTMLARGEWKERLDQRGLVIRHWAAPRWIGWPPSTRWPRTTATTSFS